MEQYKLVTIMQLKREAFEKMFLSHSALTTAFGGINIDDYTEVYTAKTNAETTLDEICFAFNQESPQNFHGHFLSVSDIIRIEEGGYYRYYYVDPVGFKRLRNLDRKAAPESGLESIHIFIDMDGVLCKWDTNDTVDDTFQRGYFLKREEEKEITKLIHLFQAAGVKTTILTAVYQNGYAPEEKKQWLADHGIDCDVIMVPYGKCKHDYVPSDGINILLDDYSKNLAEWITVKGHVGVKFFNGINGKYGTWKGYALNVAQGAEAMFKTLLGIALVESE